MTVNELLKLTAPTKPPPLTPNCLKLLEICYAHFHKPEKQSPS